MATDVSSVVNHFPEAQNGFSTTLASTAGSGATTVVLNSIGSYTNGKPVVLVVDPTDASKKQTFTGIVDTANTQITNVVWTAGTNQSHAGGATVVDYFTATVVDMIVKGILVEHGQDGKHDAVTADSLVIADGGNIEVDHILEAASGHGVDIDGLLIKDGVLPDANVKMPKISNPYKARAFANTGQTINDNSATAITFGTESYDTNSNFATNAYTVPVTGYYQINLQATITSIAKIAVATIYAYSDATIIGAVSNAQGTALDSIITLVYSDVVYLTANKVITAKAYCDTSDGSTASVGGSAAGTQTFMSIHLLSV